MGYFQRRGSLATLERSKCERITPLEQPLPGSSMSFLLADIGRESMVDIVTKPDELFPNYTDGQTAFKPDSSFQAKMANPTAAINIAEINSLLFRLRIIVANAADNLDGEVNATASQLTKTLQDGVVRINTESNKGLLYIGPMFASGDGRFFRLIASEVCSRTPRNLRGSFHSDSSEYPTSLDSRL